MRLPESARGLCHDGPGDFSSRTSSRSCTSSDGPAKVVAFPDKTPVAAQPAISPLTEPLRRNACRPVGSGFGITQSYVSAWYKGPGGAAATLLVDELFASDLKSCEELRRLAGGLRVMAKAR